MTQKRPEPQESLRTALDPAARAIVLHVADRLRQIATFRTTGPTIAGAVALAVALTAVAFAVPSLAGVAFYTSIGGLLAAWVFLGWRSRRQPRDLPKAARAIERRHPQLGQMLSTALEQSGGNANSFFATRLRQLVRSHPTRSDWSTTAAPAAARVRWTYAALAIATLFVGLYSYRALERSSQLAESDGARGEDALAQVLPGDTTLERGSSLLITARFDGALPAAAQLVTRAANGSEQTLPMAQSLSDPVFAVSIPRIQNDLRYLIRFDNGESEEFSVAVFDLPDLAKADATLDYPEYTRISDRTIEDTRRISAVEGTALDYQFQMNKPLQRAYLVDTTSGAEQELEPVGPNRDRFRLQIALSEPLRYRLHLVDYEGRRNRIPPDIRIEALPNLRPNLRFASPRGDQRLSPIEEVMLRGNASDDFGLLNYGFSYTVDQNEPLSAEIEGGSGGIEYAAVLESWLRFEELGLKPGSLVSWHLWAEDIGPDGQRRRTASDLYFAEIRPLDEIYREQDGGGAGNSGQAGESGGVENLVEQQRQMSIALFRIRQNTGHAEEARDDLQALQSSQEQIEAQLSQIMTQLQEASAVQKAETARQFMESTVQNLNTAIGEISLEPVGDAWTTSQGALQALLAMATNEYNVGRSQNASSGGSASRNQSQLNQLRFQQEENRYETATQAQPIASETEREEMQMLSRLNQLGRRQQDLNEQLRSLQSALATAADEEERERIQRELRRLEEEQRQLLADMDETLQNAPNSERSREAQRQLQETRDEMQQAGEKLSEGEVSQALASGSRAQEGIEQTREQMRQRAASQFAESMRDARQQAQELAERQRASAERLAQIEQESARRLEATNTGKESAQELEAIQESFATLMDKLQQIVEDSEQSEPTLHRKLYDLVRQQSGSGIEEQLEQDAELLRQGFVAQALQNQETLSEDLQRLAEAIDSASSSILGDSASALRFAENELDALGDQLRQEQETREGAEGDEQGADGSAETGERSASDRAGTGNGNEGFGESFINDIVDTVESGQGGPLTGGRFGDWAERLRTVEDLMEDGDMRQRLSEAREVAESTRRDFKRHSETPQWEMIEAGILQPLVEVRDWIQHELRQREDPDALQPIDRDPVPQEYSEAVRSYYQTLGED